MESEIYSDPHYLFVQFHLIHMRCSINTKHESRIQTETRHVTKVMCKDFSLTITDERTPKVC